MNFDNQIIKEWKELGFYYQFDQNLKQWWLIGSKDGLFNFVTAINAYLNIPNNNSISEHIHFGPHSYLKILTWDTPQINSNYIGGSFDDLHKLTNLIADKLHLTEIGSVFTIGSEYDLDSEYSIKFFVMSDNFDPSQIEYN